MSVLCCCQKIQFKVRYFQSRGWLQFSEYQILDISLLASLICTGHLDSSMHTAKYPITSAHFVLTIHVHVFTPFTRMAQGGRKVVCGDGEGNLMIYNWGLWGDITDRYPGHPQAIECLVKISDSVICTGCADGLLRYSTSSNTTWPLRPAYG